MAVANINENFKDLFADFMVSSNKEGKIVKGVVMAIEKDNVIVDINLKTEGIVPLKEFSIYGKKPQLQAGDEVEVFLEKIESRSGYAILSREKALREQSWHLLEKSLQNNESILGVITEQINGGSMVDLQGIVAFLPKSHVDIKHTQDVRALIGLEQPFKILQMDKKAGNIVVSRKAILDEVRVEARKEMLSQLSKGQILEGTVKNICSFGAFIDLGIIDGLMPNVDMAWTRVEVQNKRLQLVLGQKVTVMVTKVEEQEGKVSLGMKQLTPNPWEEIGKRFPEGTRFKGKVTEMMDHGVNVQIEQQMEGLVHIANMSWNKSTALPHPSKLVSVGEEVECVVLEIDPLRGQVKLGMKQCSENPWEEFAKEHPIGSIVEGEVKNIVEFGIFVGFNKYVDGLVHSSEIVGNEELMKCTRGQKIKVKILSLDVTRERIGLGMRQLQDDLFDAFINTISKNDILSCTVKKIENEGIVVELAKNITSTISKHDLSLDKEMQKPEKFNVGEQIEALVESINTENRVIKLSIKALELQEQQKVMLGYSSSGSSKSSFGDILGEALNKKDIKEE